MSLLTLSGLLQEVGIYGQEVHSMRWKQRFLCHVNHSQQNCVTSLKGNVVLLLFMWRRQMNVNGFCQKDVESAPNLGLSMKNELSLST